MKPSPFFTTCVTIYATINVIQGRYYRGETYNGPSFPFKTMAECKVHEDCRGISRAVRCYKGFCKCPLQQPGYCCSGGPNNYGEGGACFRGICTNPDYPNEKPINDLDDYVDDDIDYNFTPEPQQIEVGAKRGDPCSVTSDCAGNLFCDNSTGCENKDYVCQSFKRGSVCSCGKRNAECCLDSECKDDDLCRDRKCLDQWMMKPFLDRARRRREARKMEREMARLAEGTTIGITIGTTTKQYDVTTIPQRRKSTKAPPRKFKSKKPSSRPRYWGRGFG